jgi:hypothetical protein
MTKTDMNVSKKKSYVSMTNLSTNLNTMREHEKVIREHDEKGAGTLNTMLEHDERHM